MQQNKATASDHFGFIIMHFYFGYEIITRWQHAGHQDTCIVLVKELYLQKYYHSFLFLDFPQ
jgi:hypothetical protein